METHESIQNDALSNSPDLHPFRMVSIYDSEEAIRDAIDASNIVLRELGDGIEADRTTWNLQLLDANNTRSLAAEEAARADVIVIALAGNEPTPALKEWVAQWQKNRELPGGLLALIPVGETGGKGALADFLYETAVTAHMDFLCKQKPRA